MTRHAFLASTSSHCLYTYRLPIASHRVTRTGPLCTVILSGILRLHRLGQHDTHGDALRSCLRHRANILDRTKCPARIRASPLLSLVSTHLGCLTGCLLWYCASPRFIFDLRRTWLWETRGAVLLPILAHILQFGSRAAKTAQVRDLAEQEGAPTDERTRPVREVGEAEEECGQGSRGPREAQ